MKDWVLVVKLFSEVGFFNKDLPYLSSDWLLL